MLIGRITNVCRQKLSGGFGRNNMVDMSSERVIEVFSEDRWNSLRKEEKQSVQGAAQTLRLPFEELHDRLLRAAEMKFEDQTRNRVENGTEVAEVGDEEEIGNREEHETGTAKIGSAPANVVAKV